VKQRKGRGGGGGREERVRGQNLLYLAGGEQIIIRKSQDVVGFDPEELANQKLVERPENRSIHFPICRTVLDFGDKPDLISDSPIMR
jgi:hypothetical protein